MNELTAEKLYTTKEVAEQLGTSPKVILENARKCLPNKRIENGKPTFWNQEEVTVLIYFMKNNKATMFNSQASQAFTDGLRSVSTELTPALKINSISIFENPEFGKVRTVIIDNEPYFVGKDIAVSLGYVKPENAVASHVDSEDKTTTLIQGDGSNYKSKTIIINESGLYALILSSKLPTAKKFKHWVTSEVLPSIRKTGSFGVPRSFAEALQLAADQQKRIEEQQLEIEQSKPKVEFFDKVTGSSDTCDMKEVAKILNFKGVGRNKLFEILRAEKILDRQNQPYQQYVDSGYFRVIESKWEDKDGDIHINLKTVVFQSGVDFIRKVLMKQRKTLPNFM